MYLSVGIESYSSGKYDPLNKIEFIWHEYPIKNGKKTGSNSFQILEEPIIIENEIELKINAFYVPETSGFALEVMLRGVFIVQLTCFESLDIAFLVPNSKRVRLYAERPKNA